METIRAQYRVPGQEIVGRAVPLERAGGSSLGFWMFVAVNFLLLVRPQELFPQISAAHPYEVLMIASLIVYWPYLTGELGWRRLKARPITLCVLLMVPISIVSLLWQGQGMAAALYTVEGVKIILYYLILLCAVSTPARIRKFAICLAVIITFVALIPLLNRVGVIHLETIRAITDVRQDAVTGLSGKVERLEGIGIFGDPNDFSQLLGVGLLLCVYGIDLRRGITKLAWAAPMAILLYAMYLTHSRGGFLGLAAGVGVLLISRFGWKKATIPGAVVLAILAAVFLANTRISTQEASAQSRVQIWSDALVVLRENPVFGVGPGGFGEIAGQVAHNSFLHAYAETGIPGGFVYFTTFYIAIWGVLRFRSRKVRALDPDMAKLTPMLASALVCYVVGMLSLTRNYAITTYTMLGLSAVYLQIVRTKPAKPPVVWSMSLLGKSFALSILYLLAMQGFVSVSFLR